MNTQAQGKQENEHLGPETSKNEHLEPGAQQKNKSKHDKKWVGFKICKHDLRAYTKNVQLSNNDRPTFRSDFRHQIVYQKFFKYLNQSQMMIDLYFDPIFDTKLFIKNFNF